MHRTANQGEPTMQKQKRWIPRPTRRQLQVGVSGVLLVVVVGAPAAASFHGLTQAGVGALGLTGGWEVLVPLVLDAGAAYTAVLALRDVLSGDSAVLNRGLTWLYATGGAGLNAWWGQTLSTAAALYFAAATLSAVVLWDRTLRAMRRDQLRDRGAVQDPTPRFRPARWAVDPKGTFRAWQIAVLEGVTDPAEAVELARREANVVQGRMERTDAATGETVEPDTDPVLEGLSHVSDQVRHAVAQLGLSDESWGSAETKEVVAWLAERGVAVEKSSYVYDVVRRDKKKAEERERAISVEEAPRLLSAS